MGNNRMSRKGSSLSHTHTLVLTALLTALALVLGFVERFIPLYLLVPIPGFRLGLANVVVLAGVYLFPLPMAFGLALLKSVTTFLLSGSLTALWIGGAGTLLSFWVMWGGKALLHGRISPVSLSAVGGLTHVAGQLAAAMLLLQTTLVAGLLPLLAASGAATGVLVGVAVQGLLPYMRRYLHLRTQIISDDKS